MKKIKILVNVLLMTFLISCGPSKSDAMKYNDKIMTILNNLTVRHNAFLNQIDGHNIDSLQLTQKSFSENAKNSIDEIVKIGPFTDSDQYFQESINYFKDMKSIADTEAKQMSDVLSNGAPALSESQVLKVSELAASFDTRYEKAFNSMETAQFAFAKEWKFEIYGAKVP